MTRIAITTTNENGVLLLAFGERVGALRPIWMLTTTIAGTRLKSS
jgi:hypothetical protein